MKKYVAVGLHNIKHPSLRNKMGFHLFRFETIIEEIEIERETEFYYYANKRNGKIKKHGLFFNSLEEAKTAIINELNFYSNQYLESHIKQLNHKIEKIKTFEPEKPDQP